MNFREFYDLFLDDLRVEVKRPRQRGSFNVDYGFLSDYRNAVQIHNRRATLLTRKLDTLGNLEVLEISKYSVILNGMKGR